MASVDLRFKVSDFPAFVELMENVANGCSHIKLNSQDAQAVFWADRILTRIEAFERGKDNV